VVSQTGQLCFCVQQLLNMTTGKPNCIDELVRWRRVVESGFRCIRISDLIHDKAPALAGFFAME
jgi:hypothetical protein